MPVIPTSQQTDAWYALPFDERNKQTFDQWLGNTSPAPAQDTARLPPSDFPGAANMKIDTPGGTGSEATTYQATPSSASDPQSAHDAAIANAFQQYLGRAASASDLATFRSNPYGNYATVPGWTQMRVQEIAQSPEAQAYAAGRKKVMPVPTVTPATGGVGPAPTATSGNTATPYSNSSQSLLLNAALQRLSQLEQPIDHTAEDAYTKMALDRVNQLSGAPFTDRENAALLTQHMAPLTQARDTAKQQAAEEMSRRGIIPSSGVFQDRMKAIDTAYERGVAGVTNTLNIQGIDATQKNAALQLQILDSLVSMGRMSRQEAEQRSLAIVQTAGIPFDTDLRTLGALTSASGGNDGGSAMSALLSLGGLNLRGSQIATDQNGQDAQAIGSVVGYILSHHQDFGF